MVGIAAVIAANGCKGKAEPSSSTGTGSVPVKLVSGSGSAGSAGVESSAGSGSDVVPTWTLVTAPIDVDCGGTPLNVPPPQATKRIVDRTLVHMPGIAPCHGLASTAAVCDCLTTSVGTWAAGTITVPARCVVATIGGLDDAAVVEASTDPSETAIKVGGRAFVFVAHQGSTWSAVDSVERVADIDRAVTPKRSGTARIDHVDVAPGRGGMLYIFQSRRSTSEHDIGETDADGTAQVTVCSVPRAPTARAFCYKALSLGAWMFTHDDSSDTCSLPTANFFTATISPTYALVRLVNGKDSYDEAGRYTF